MSHCESPWHTHLQGRLGLEGTWALRGNRAGDRKRLLGQERDTEHQKAMQGGWFGWPQQMSGRWYGSGGKTRLHRPWGPGQPTSGFGDSGEQLIVCYADSMTSACLYFQSFPLPQCGNVEELRGDMQTTRLPPTVTQLQAGEAPLPCSKSFASGHFTTNNPAEKETGMGTLEPIQVIWLDSGWACVELCLMVAVTQGPGLYGRGNGMTENITEEMN